jgi:hypothetical protein
LARNKIHPVGVLRGRADTPGFYRSPDMKHGQQATAFGVPPLPQTNVQQEVRIFDAGFLLCMPSMFDSLEVKVLYPT